jgi:hypothetical protein
MRDQKSLNIFIFISECLLTGSCRWPMPVNSDWLFSICIKMALLSNALLVKQKKKVFYIWIYIHLSFIFKTTIIIVKNRKKKCART